MTNVEDRITKVSEKYGWDMRTVRAMVKKTQEILGIPHPEAIEFLLEINASARTICDGCNVREPFEHRCHRGRSVVQGEQTGKKCQCVECFIVYNLI